LCVDEDFAVSETYNRIISKASVSQKNYNVLAEKSRTRILSMVHALIFPLGVAELIAISKALSIGKMMTWSGPARAIEVDFCFITNS
jgi:hypothetical protein